MASPGARRRAREAFAARLRGAVSVPVELIDESFSTVEAEEVLLAADVSRARRREVIDKMAAAVILRRWMDAHATEERSTDREDQAMKRALIVFLITSALGLIALIVVARTAWRYGDTPGGTASGKVTVEIPNGRQRR